MNAANRIGEVLVETYRIERLIAEGGMGSVYEARHLRLPKRFAVKFLNLRLVDNDEAQARFKREAEIIAALDHPNIVSPLDYNVTGEGVPFIVLEYLDGEHLGTRIARGTLPLSEALRVMSKVVAALGAAHALHIVHRDLKPENIVLCRDEMVKVVDFGIAKIRGGQELTALNTILGTVPYMAPEQLLGAEVTPRTDQFALASIVYEMLTGEMAFGGPASVPEVAARIAHHQPPDVKGVPRAVNAVLFQAMAKDAEARFPSVKAFFEAMEEAARQPADSVGIVDDAVALDNGLPPLAGEATTVSPIASRAPIADRPSLGDESGGAPSRVDEARKVEPMAQLATVRIDRSAIAPRPDLESTAVVALPPASDALVAQTQGIPPHGAHESAAPDDLAVPQLRRAAFTVWIAVAAVAAAVVAAFIWLLLSRGGP